MHRANCVFHINSFFLFSSFAQVALIFELEFAVKIIIIALFSIGFLDLIIEIDLAVLMNFFIIIIMKIIYFLARTLRFFPIIAES